MHNGHRQDRTDKANAPVRVVSPQGKGGIIRDGRKRRRCPINTTRRRKTQPPRPKINRGWTQGVIIEQLARVILIETPDGGVHDYRLGDTEAANLRIQQRQVTRRDPTRRCACSGCRPGG